jgi:PIN domain nuclease of toxin-antitoxin system
VEGRLRLLLDTHVAIWALDEPKRLSAETRQTIETEENDIFVSVVSPWELAIKGPREGLRVPDDFEKELIGEGITLLPVLWRHIAPLKSMTYHHRDPFDRMLVAQALTEGLTIVTADRKLRNYPVSLMPAI